MSGSHREAQRPWIAGRRAATGAAVGFTLFAVSDPARAEDLKGRWYFGTSLAFLPTTDSIRSNAGIVLGRVGDDGIPFSGDLNEDQDCTPGAPTTFCDPRPDDLVGRELIIEETFKLDLTAGFGMTSRLSLQLDASYFWGDVGPVDAYLSDHFPISTIPVDPTNLNTFKDRKTVIPIQAGELTEIPVSLTGIVRFRKDSTLNPYLGFGGGVIFANMERSPEVDAFNERLESMRLREVVNEYNRSVLPRKHQALVFDGLVPLRWPVEVDVDDGLEWHLVGGAEFFFSEWVSMVFDARYTFAEQSVTIDLGGEDQVNLLIYSEAMFRRDGSVFIFNSRPPVAPNTLCAETDYQGIGCNPIARPPNQHVDPTGVDPATGGALGECPNVFDFDKNGQIDFCYSTAVIGESRDGAKEPRGDVVVQGGSIDLTGFSVAIGVRFHF